MSLRSCSNNGRKGFKWGSNGACFTGRNARQRALEQGVASELESRREGNQFDFKSFTTISDLEFYNALVSSEANSHEIMVILATRKVFNNDSQ